MRMRCGNRPDCQSLFREGKNERLSPRTNERRARDDPSLSVFWRKSRKSNLTFVDAAAAAAVVSQRVRLPIAVAIASPFARTRAGGGKVGDVNWDEIFSKVSVAALPEGSNIR